MPWATWASRPPRCQTHARPMNCLNSTNRSNAEAMTTPTTGQRTRCAS
jgi:hypothetical protein